MCLAPVFKGTVAFALDGGVLWCYLAVRHNLNLSDSGDKRRVVPMVEHNLHLTPLRNRFVFCFDGP